MGAVRYKIGDRYRHEPSVIEGNKTDDMVILSANEYHVVCMPEFLFPGFLEKARPEEPETYIATGVIVYNIESFQKWYPHYLVNMNEI